MRKKLILFLWLCFFLTTPFQCLLAENFRVYRNNLNNREFDKKTSLNLGQAKLAPTQSKTDSSDDCSIYGVVTDAATKKPIEKAFIEVTRGEKEKYSTSTNSEGKYQINDLLPGNYILIAKASGYEAQSMALKTIQKQNNEQNISLNPVEMRVSGRVFDCHTEKPIVGAMVRVLAGDSLLSSTSTDSLGQYTLSTENLEGSILAISAPGYESRSVGLYDKKGDQDTDGSDLCLKPKKGAVIAGVVKDAKTHNPIPHAQIVMSFASFYDTVFTDSTGVYSLENAMKHGFYTLSVSCDGYETAVSSIWIDEDGVYTSNIFLKKDSGIVSGIIQDASGHFGISNAQVEIYDKTLLIASTLVNSSGSYSLTDLEYGNYIIVVTADGYQSQSQGISIDSESLSANFFLQQDSVSILGVVSDSESLSPIAGAVIRVMKNSINLINVESAEDGSFQISGLKLGSYTIAISSQGYQTAYQGLNLQDDATKTLNVSLALNPGSLFGKISSDFSKYPISGASVQLYEGSVLVASAITDANGDYLIPNLAPHTYSLLIDASGYQRSVQTIEIQSDSQTVTNCPLMLGPGILFGKVYNQNTEAPIAGATVSVFLNNHLVGANQSDEQGNYTISNLAPGMYQILAVASGYQSKSLQGEVSEQSPKMVRFSSFFVNSSGAIDVPLVQGGSSMTVTALNACLNNALSGANVSLNNIPIGITDVSGQWHFSGFTSGATEEVTISKSGFKSETLSIEVVSGGPSNLNISLAPLALAPPTISCKALKNKFLVNLHGVYQISWTASPGSCVVGYQILKDQTQIGFVSSQEKLQFMDHGVSFNEFHVYSVQAVNAFGIISPPINVSVF